MKLTRTLAALPVAGALVFSACGSDSSTTSDTGVTIPRITLGMTADPESRLIAELYAQTLEGAGYRVARKTAYADDAALYAAVLAGEVQLTAQRTNSLLRILDATADPIGGVVVTTIPITLPPAVADTTTTAALDAAADATSTTIATPPDPLATLRSALPDTLAVGDAASAVHAQVIACNSTLETLATVTTISELAKLAGDLRLGGPTAFETASPFGVAALTKEYSATFKEFVAVDDATLGDKITAGDLDCGVFESTDSDITTASLKILVDDLALAPIDAVLPLLTAPAATADTLSILNSVSDSLTTSALNQMLAQITVAEVDPGLVAKNFLSNTGT